MSTIAQTLKDAQRTLEPHSDSPRLDAELLLGTLIGQSRAGLIAHGDEPVTAECGQTYAALIAKRLRGAPVAYLTGSREFWSLPIHVTPDVLVPRPETELVVDLALQAAPAAAADASAARPFAVLDLGTGSGAIALALASERPRWRVTGVDVSPQALAVAAENSRRLGLSHIDWRPGSWFEPVAGERFDLIVANPPYIAADDPALGRLRAEPFAALSPGPTGLEALSHIAKAAGAHLTAGGRLIVEHGADQAEAVVRLLAQQGFLHVHTHSDFSGKPRVTLGTVHSHHQEPT